MICYSIDLIPFFLLALGLYYLSLTRAGAVWRKHVAIETIALVAAMGVHTSVFTRMRFQATFIYIWRNHWDKWVQAYLEENTYVTLALFLALNSHRKRRLQDMTESDSWKKGLRQTIWWCVSMRFLAHLTKSRQKCCMSRPIAQGREERKQLSQDTGRLMFQVCHYRSEEVPRLNHISWSDCQVSIWSLRISYCFPWFGLRDWPVCVFINPFPCSFHEPNHSLSLLPATISPGRGKNIRHPFFPSWS